MVQEVCLERHPVHDVFPVEFKYTVDFHLINYNNEGNQQITFSQQWCSA